MGRRVQEQRDTDGSPAGDPLRAAAITVGLFFALALVIVAVAVGFTLAGDSGSGPPRAVIVDQLSLTAPNPEFAEEATRLLEAAGYDVDYVPGEFVTVDYYRTLPERDYDVVLLRAHAARHYVDGEATDDTRLFTSEPYNIFRHVEDQRAGLLSLSYYDDPAYDDDTRYFGIGAGFVESAMRGDFDGANVVLMGCDVLRGERLAAAFVDKGAGVVVGWDRPVTAAHTDAATLSLLRRYLVEGQSFEEAAAAASAELGPDPFYEGVMLSYTAEE